MALGLLIVAAVLPVWLAPRLVAALSALAAAVPIYLLARIEAPFWTFISLMVCVAAIVLLAPRSARPPRAWLWLISSVAVACRPTSRSAGWLVFAPLIALVSSAWHGSLSMPGWQ